ncbi:MAG: ThuA domain-containing protein [Verrucomicrobia bacterium]|nr:ThuA domain-containing protein [Verrucomicrobiota bacterium]
MNAFLKTSFCLLLGWAVSFATAAEQKPSDGYPYPGPAAPPPKPLQVLLVTGCDYPGHKWPLTAPVLAQGLREDPRADVRVVEDAHFLDSAALDRYHVVVLHYMNWKTPGPGEAARANLKRFVENGGGLVMVHFACGAWMEWPEFVNLAGRVWNPKLRGHDPRGPFQVEIVQPDHPIMKGLQPFETEDELYTCLDGNVPIEVLAKATSKVDKKDYPMAFVLNVGKGRVFHSPLGHDVKAFSAPVLELFRRGTAWAAGRPPTADTK